MSTLTTRRLGAALALAATLTATAAPALAQRVSVQELDSRRIAVHANTRTGDTPEQAGMLAKQRACEETINRGFTHFAVNEYTTKPMSSTASTSHTDQQYHVTQDGQVYNQPRTTSGSRTVTWGNAMLMVQLMNERVAVAPGPGRIADVMQVVDARTCEVVP